MKFAIAKFKVKNTVPGFELYLGDQCYGHYPCDEGRFEESMTAAVSDALGYGFHGIVIPGDWKTPGSETAAKPVLEGLGS